MFGYLGYGFGERKHYRSKCLSLYHYKVCNRSLKEEEEEEEEEVVVVVVIGLVMKRRLGKAEYKYIHKYICKQKRCIA